MNTITSMLTPILLALAVGILTGSLLVVAGSRYYA
jgi:hypothetical protein